MKVKELRAILEVLEGEEEVIMEIPGKDPCYVSCAKKEKYMTPPYMRGPDIIYEWDEGDYEEEEKEECLVIYPDY